MPAGTRIRDNNVMGVISDTPLTAIATTFNSANLQLLSVINVGAQHAIVTFDPLRQYGEPEIAIVTAHSASATVATVQRGAYGTVAREHPQNAVWVHQPMDHDYTEILTSGTRPSDPFRGQMIFETDFNRFVARDMNDSWQTVVELGTWQTYTPVLAAGWAIGAGTNIGRWTRVGRTIFFEVRIVFGAGATFSATAFTFTLPPVAPINTDNDRIIGTANYYDADASQRIGLVALSGGNALATRLEVSGVNIQRNTVTSTTPFTWVATDRMFYTGYYEAAA